MPTNNRVFISCVSDEFEKPQSPFPGLREQLRHYLTRADCEAKVQEEFRQSGDRDTVESLAGYIGRCAAVIHLVGELPGAVANKKAVVAYLAEEPTFLANHPEVRGALGDFSDLTYTQWEAFLALHYGVPLFVYATETGAKAQEVYLNRLRLRRRHPGDKRISGTGDLLGQLIGDLRYIVPAFGEIKRVAVTGVPPASGTPLFKDRVRERQELGQLLAEGRFRMVTLLGRGGIGKSALACHVLYELERNRWPHTDEGPTVDGIAYLSTRTQGISLDRIFLYGARLLGGEQGERISRVWATSDAEIPLEEKAHRLMEALSNGLYVLLLDNVEDLLDDRGHFRDPSLNTFFGVMLARPDGVRFLFTSREPVRIGDMRVRPHDKHLLVEDGLPEKDAIALLRDLDPNSTCQAAIALDETLARVVTFTHGVPRALELVVSLLDDHDELTLDDVLQTFYRQDEVVQKLVEEHFRRLAPDARRVLQALAVLGRPVKAEAVECLLQGVIASADVRGIIKRLVRTHAVSKDREAGKVTLHPIDKEYAYSQLDESGPLSDKALHKRAADYYRSQRRSIVSKWLNLDDLEPQLCEFEHLTQAQLFDEAAIALGEFGGELAWHGSPRQCRTMANGLAGRLTTLQARLAYHCCSLAACLLLGPMVQALRHGLERLSIAVQLVDKAEEGWAHQDLGVVYRYLERPTDAIEHAERAVQIFRKSGIGPQEFICLTNASLSNSYGMRVLQALAHGREALAFAEAWENDRARGGAHDALSLAYFTCCRWADAVQHAGKAVTFWEEPRQDAFGYVLNIKGVAHFMLGETENAEVTLLSARAAAIKVESPRVEGITLHNLAVIMYLQSKLEVAEEYATRAQALLAPMGVSAATDAFVRLLAAAHMGHLPTEAEMLLECARASLRNADLYPATELAARCAAIADRCERPRLAQQAQQFVQEQHSRLPTAEELQAAVEGFSGCG